MQDFDISTAGVAKLLSNLSVTKATGPDAIRPIVLKQLSQVVAAVITNRHLSDILGQWYSAH